MKKLKCAGTKNQQSVFAVMLLLYISILPAQSQPDELLTGSWELEQTVHSKQPKNMLLNITYSAVYNRYFGNISVYGTSATLDSITFDTETGGLKFSSHLRNKHSFALNVTSGNMAGTAVVSGINYKISGRKTNSAPVTNIIEYGNYKRTVLPDSIKDYYTETGNRSADIVLLIVQGGPFDEAQFTANQLPVDKWKDELHIVYVKQAQIINPSILPPENMLRLEDAEYENLISVEMLHRTIQYFKGQHKKVLVWGVSYGAWLMQKYIEQYGIEADAISMAAGRLDMEPEIWKDVMVNQKAYDITYNKEERIYQEMDFTYTRPVSCLLASIVKERFIKSLSKKDLSRFVVYQFANRDGTVGRLTNPEIVFLKSKRVSIEVCNKCYHRQMLSGKMLNSAVQKMLESIE